jgi:iron complex outermembrane recepter protein
MRTLYLLLSFLLFSAALSAQKLSGSVTNVEGVPLGNASVSLQRAKDSSVQKLTVTTDSGRFSFSIKSGEKYFITASFIGYKTVHSAVIQSVNAADVNEVNLVLRKVKTDLKEITVTATKPMLEVKADKMVMNVEGTINAAGSDAMELLKKAPGITVDNDDRIALSGKNGTQIFIDGKPSPLTGTDLSSYLKSIQAAQIESIEIITNPSARYEAAGNAGIINIRLKKNKALGTNGSVNAGYGIGVYAKYNAGFSLNYRDKKVNLFSTYTYNRGINEINTASYRIQQDTIFDQRFGRFIRDNGHNLKLGADYFINKANTLGVIFATVTGTQHMEEPGQTFITYAPTNQYYRRLVSTSLSDTRRSNSNINLNYRYEQKDKEWNIDADYGAFTISNERLQPNAYYNVANSYLYGRTYNMLTPMDIKLSSMKLNHVRKFGGGKLDIGGKVSLVTNNNNFQRYDVVANGKQLDSLRSNGFVYKEHINALYVNYSRERKAFTWQMGVRVENTIVTGQSTGFTQKSTLVAYDSSFKRNYTDVFPSASLTWRKDANNQIGISYSKRIDRPIYQFLNPFEYKVDEYTYRKGNTSLQPQYTNNIGLTYVYKNKLTAVASYSHTKAMIAQVFDTTEKTKSFITNTNLAEQNLVSLNLNYIVQHKRFSGFINVNPYYAQTLGDFGNGRTVDISMVTVSARSQQSLKIGKTITAELVETYTSPSIWEGTFKSKSIGSIDAGLQKQFMDGKATVKLSVADIFYTMQGRAVNNFAGQNQTIFRAWEPRLFRLNATYRFGSNQVKAARQRKTGLEEEGKRVQGG